MGETTIMRRATSADELTEYVQSIRQSYNILTPMQGIGSVPAGHEVICSMVKIDAFPTGQAATGEVYRTKSGGYALTKSALDKIAAAAGIRFLHEQCVRMDDGSDPQYARYRAVAEITDPDGGVRTIPADADQRSGDFIPEKAESRAMNRVIRRAVGVKSSYTQAELQKPFVALKLVHTGRYGDPELDRMAKKLQMMQTFGVTGSAAALLFGNSQQPAMEAQPSALIEAPAINALPLADESHTGSSDYPSADDVAGSPPVDMTRGDDPTSFVDLDDEAQVAELLALAGRKGKDISEHTLRSATTTTRLKTWDGLNNLPDADHGWNGPDLGKM